MRYEDETLRKRLNVKELKSTMAKPKNEKKSLTLVDDKSNTDKTMTNLIACSRYRGSKNTNSILKPNPRFSRKN